MFAAIVVVGCGDERASVDARREPSARERWNGYYATHSRDPGLEGDPNALLVEVARGLPPGRALDVGCGSGANATWLSSIGWDVTGVDISDEAIDLARKRASARGVRVELVRADAKLYDYGDAQWDLVAFSYVHSFTAGLAERVVRGLAPGGVLVVEGFRAGADRRLGFDGADLRLAYGELTILRYEEVQAPSYWSRGRDAPIIRMVARKRASSR